MDTETSGEVLDASETPQPEETKMEREVDSKVETPEESTEPEKPPAAAEETGQLAVNGHDTEVENFERTEVVIVTENVTSSEEKADGDSVPKDQSDIEVVPAVVATLQPDESAEKISDPVAALATEPENITLEQQPVPENNPEALPVQMPLAETAPLPEPEKLAESVPEAEIQQQTLPEPVAMEQPVEVQPVEVQPPGPEENLPKQVEAKVEEQPAEETTKMEEAEKNITAEPTNEVQEEKPAEMVQVPEVSSEKPAEMVQVPEVSSEKPAETVQVPEVSSEKPAETVQVPEVSSENPTEEKSVEPESVKVAEAAVAAEVVEPEKKETELEKEEDVPAAGSLSFALLEREQTKETLLTSRTLVVLRGLPGSGKSFLARAIADAYKDHCSIICADDHGLKPENGEPSADGYKALDEAVVTCCSAGTASPLLIIVDDINHSQDRLARLGEIAQEHQLVAIFLEPKTTWSRDVGQLSKKTRRGLKEATLEAMKSPFEEMVIPLFFGWFLLSSVQEKVKCTSMDFLKTLDTLEIFKKHMTDFTDKPENEVDLEQYFKDKGFLHCTTKFCDYGKANGAKEYAQNTAVNDSYGAIFELSLSALFVTPRTVGAKVSLTEEQLLLWPADAESSVPAAASLPLGSRAHITLGCAEGVEPVQTGLDLLDISILQQEGQKGEQVDMELGQLTYFGEGRWFLSLTEPICVPACFSSSYMRKESESAKKESEKKKKSKCAIL